MIPYAVSCDRTGKIREDRGHLMLARRGREIFTPELGEMRPLPQESELFFLSGRHALGKNIASGEVEELAGLAVAGFAAPGYTLSATPAYRQESDAPMLPLFAYGAVGFARGKFWICAVRTDSEPRQRFSDIPPRLIELNARKLLREFPHNRLVGHIINNCVRKYDCPAARNFALGRYEAPLPTSRACNARCLGCISSLQPDTPVTVTPQCRLEFTPDVQEIVEVMQIHQKREKERPVYSFGQGCEGDPLTNADLLRESVAVFRKAGGHGTVNCNTNAGRTEAVIQLAQAGLTSMRVSLNSARPELYEAYYRPLDYAFSDVVQSIREASSRGIFVALNLLFFPGLTDTEPELEALATLCARAGVSMIQWRNLNVDPQWYMERMAPLAGGEKPTGLSAFMAGLHERCPWLHYGYFNPWLGDRAQLDLPETS